MTIATYTDLKNSVARWLSRRGDLTDVIPDFIELGEARIARDLRLQRQITTGSLVTVGGTATVALPASWLEFISISIEGQVRALDIGTLNQVAGDYASTETGMPVKAAIRGDVLLLSPTPDSVYNLTATYYTRFDALSDTTATTWLLTNHPGAYLWSALAEAAPFISADQRIAIWEGKYAAEIEAIRAADQNARFGGGTIHQVSR